MKIVEATIAVLLIISVILIISSKNTFEKKSNLDAQGYEILDELANNQIFREEVIRDSINKEDLEDFAKERLKNPSLNLRVQVCNLSEVCEFDIGDYSGNVYVYERVISSSINENNFEPKKIKLFIWNKVN